MSRQFFYHYFSYSFLNAGFVAENDTLKQILLGCSKDECTALVKHRYTPLSTEKSPFLQLIVQLEEYLDGNRKEFSISYILNLPPFYEMVLKTVAQIPYGTFATYKSIAGEIGHPRAYRAVGNALHINPIPIIIPCHRVIKSDSTLGGFGGGIELKRSLLTLEGITVKK